MSSTAELLERAADIQEERGLSQQAFIGSDGTLCTAASLFLARGFPESQLPGQPGSGTGYVDEMGTAEAQDAMRALNFGSAISMCQWNNELGRTSEQVVARFRAGAEAARRREMSTT